MKTNQVLQSSDRELFGVTIRQNTKGEFLSVTDLQKAYEKGKWMYGWNGQTVNQLLMTDEVAKKCFGVLSECDLIKCDFLKFMEMVKNQSLVNVLKGLELYKVTGRGENKQVMAHPYIWFTIAIELNYVLYGKTIKWLADSLIFDRIDAGSEYMPMNKSIASIIEKPDYTKFAKAINIRVFGIHKTGMRNMATAKDLRKIADIEKFIINLIKQGLIKTEDQILTAIELYS